MPKGIDTSDLVGLGVDEVDTVGADLSEVGHFGSRVGSANIAIEYFCFSGYWIGDGSEGGKTRGLTVKGECDSWDIGG